MCVVHACEPACELPADVTGFSMSFHLSDFLSGHFDPELQTALKDIEAFPAHLTHCMLSGPPRSGKTSILLLYAYKAAIRGQQVVLLCHRDKMEQTYPTLPQGVHKTSPAWQRVQLRYLSTSQELQKYAACLHLAPTPPNILIVDDVSEFMLSSSDPQIRGVVKLNSSRPLLCSMRQQQACTGITHLHAVCNPVRGA
ncbi:TPA: hypothetical protein ACH3X3_014482 [Trebouxia sp. C0006]